MTDPSASEMFRLLYEPMLAERHGMAWAEIVQYVQDHGHLPPYADGQYKGRLPCDPIHAECSHLCEEHRL